MTDGTVRIGVEADGSAFQRYLETVDQTAAASLEGLRKESAQLEAELAQVERALQFNPQSSILLAQKQELAAKAAANTRRQLALMTSAQTNLNQALQNQPEFERAYKEASREIEKAAEKLAELKKRKQEADKVFSNAGVTANQYERLEPQIARAEQALQRLQREKERADQAMESPVSSHYQKLQADIEKAAEKLEELKAKKLQADRALEEGGVSLESYRALQREISDSSDALEELERSREAVNRQFEAGHLDAGEFRAAQREMAELSGSLHDLDQAARQGFRGASSHSRRAAGEVESHWSGLKKTISSALSGLGSAAASALKGTVTAIGAASAGLTALGGAAVKVGMDFESSMSEVGAISGAVGEPLEDLTAKAKAMGASTKFSATEAAQALKYMAMAGWETDDMLDGIDGVMNLAAASGEELAAVSDIVTDAMTAFGLEAGEAAGFADVLAQASASSNTSVGMMGATFQYVAPLAGAMGYTIQDTAVAVGLLANAGIKGEKAGTALRSMFTRLASPPKDAAAAMEALGISIKTASGQMLPLSDVMVQLREKFSGLSQEQQIQMASSLAGQEAMSGLLAIVNASPKDFDDLTAAVENSKDAAQRMADTMQDNLKGALTVLNSGLEGLGIQFKESVDQPLKEMVQLATEGVGQLSAAFESGGIQGLAESAGRVFADIAVKISEYIPVMLESASAVISSLLEGIQRNLQPIAQSGVSIVMELVGGIGSVLSVFLEAASQMVTVLLEGIAENASVITNTAVSLVETLVRGILDNLPVLGQAAMALLISLADSLTQSLPELIPVAVQAVMTLVQGLVDNSSAFLDAAMDLILALADGLMASIPLLLENLPQLIESLVKGLVEQSQKMIVGGTKLVIALANGLIKGIPELLMAIPKILISMVQGFTEGSGNMEDVGKELLEAVWEGFASLKDWFFSKMREFAETIASYLLLDFNRDARKRFIQSAAQTGRDAGEALVSSYRTVASGRALKNAKTVSEALSQAGKLTMEALTAQTQQAQGNFQAGLESSGAKAAESAKKTGKDYSKALAQGIRGEKVRVGDALEELVSQAAESAKKGAKDYKSAGTLLAQGVEQGIRDRVSQAEKAVQEYAEAVAESLAQADEEAAEEFRKGKDTFLQAYTELLEQNAEEAVAAVSEKLQAVSQEAQNQYDKLIRQRDALAQKLADFGDLFTVSQVERQGNGYTETLTKVDYADLDQQYRTIETYYRRLEELRDRGASENLLGEIMGMKSEEAIAVMGDLLEKSQEEFSAFTEKFAQVQELAEKKAAEFYQKQIDQVKTGFTDQITQVMGEIPGMVREAGLDSTEGFVEGLSANMEQVSGGARQVADTLLLALRSALDCHSPSKETQVIGEYAGEGFLRGMEGYAGTIRDSAYSIGQDAAQSLRDGFQASLEGLSLQMRQAAQAQAEGISASFSARSAFSMPIPASGLSGGSTSNETNQITMNIDMKNIQELNDIVKMAARRVQSLRQGYAPP